MKEELKEKREKSHITLCTSQNKGITLVALIITIIVLLILAVVAIRAVQGDGIISHAKNAQTEYAKKQAEEAVQLALDEWKIVGNTQTEGNLKTFLEDKFPNSVEEDGPYIVTVDGYEVTVSEDGTITGTEKALPKPVVDEASIKITKDGTNVPAEEELTIGTTVQIYFEASIEGGEITSISPSVPYTTNGTEMSKEFTIVGTVNGEESSIKKTISVAKYYKIDHSEVVIGTIAKTGVFENNSYIAEVREGDIPIPTGFTYVKGDKIGGAVITDGTSEFVWIPVSNINNMVMCQTHGASVTLDTTTLQCPTCGANTKLAGKLYATSAGNNFNASLTGQTYTKNSGFREPDNLSSSYDSTKLMSIWTPTLYQVSFNKMVESVAKYKGFYVGRYEMSLNASGNAQSKLGATSATDAKDSANMWYGLYAKAKTYTKSSIESEMIWGSQYDAMMKWMKGNGINVTISTPTDLSIGATSKNQTRITGSQPKDKLCNIYDLLGNSLEYTQEAEEKDDRVARGGTITYVSSLSNRGTHVPTFYNGEYSTRLSLYIKCTEP